MESFGIKWNVEPALALWNYYADKTGLQSLSCSSLNPNANANLDKQLNSDFRL